MSTNFPHWKINTTVCILHLMFANVLWKLCTTQKRFKYWHTDTYIDSCDALAHVVGWPRSGEKLSNRAFSSKSPSLWSSSCFLVAANSSFVVLNSSLVDTNSSRVVWSSFWVDCSWPCSSVTTGDVYAAEVLALTHLTFANLSNTDGPLRIGDYLLQTLLEQWCSPSTAHTFPTFDTYVLIYTYTHIITDRGIYTQVYVVLKYSHT